MSTPPLTLYALNRTALTNAHVVSTVGHRHASIDMLRGLIILFMLLDHLRETFFYITKLLILLI